MKTLFKHTVSEQGKILQYELQYAKWSKGTLYISKYFISDIK